MSNEQPNRHLERRHRELIDGFAVWADDEVVAEDVECMFDYKRSLGDDRLTRWNHDDVDRLFLTYLPAKAILDPQEAADVMESVATFFLYLAEEQLADISSDPTEDLTEHLWSHLDEFRDAMADPSTGGPAKRIAMAMLDDGIDLEDADTVQEWIDEFNAGPLGARDAILGPPLDFEDEPAIVLPPRPAVYREEAAGNAASSPIIEKITMLANFMGSGRPLTTNGNLKLADARQLVDLLETGDVVDYELGDRHHSFQSATELVWLDLIVYWAREIGAVKERRNRMSANKSFMSRLETDPLAPATEIASSVFDLGPSTLLFGDDAFGWDPVGALIEASPASVIAGLYEADQPYEQIVSRFTESIPLLVDVPAWYLRTDDRGESHLDRSARLDIERMVMVMELTGLLEWDSVECRPDGSGFRDRLQGGNLSITPFGEWMVQSLLVERGMVSAPRPLEVTLHDPPEAIVEALAALAHDGPERIGAAWEELGGDQSLLERLWRVDRLDTVLVLEALGSAISHKPTAKAARKALLKHRSWIAGRS